ncbi:hypothetical protein QTP88_001498 [Uroleucon formosanum]
MEQRLNCKNLSFDLRKQIHRFTGQISTPTQEDPRPTERVKCAYCPARKNRYTLVKCARCSVPLCKEHTLALCSLCNGNNEDLDD